jgi:hypothetical protein
MIRGRNARLARLLATRQPGLSSKVAVMGIYPQSKEVPEPVMAQVLQRPEDPEWVDGLLFTRVRPGIVEWSEATTRSALSDDELERRFSCPYLPFSAAERRTLGTLDLGKFPYWDSGETFWRYVDAAGSGTPAPGLAGLLSEDEEAWHEAIDEREGPPRASPPAGSAPRPAVRTGVPCYGISGYQTPAEMAGTWHRIDRAVAAHPGLTGRVVELFGEHIRYYYGCAARSSAEITAVW